ncbi:hypothetical protein OKT76_01035 [Providencia rettgeri]|uniref:hypothetical protein n=1 Tax=Providencia rettgeri TaxID=587 RepID=UPI0022704827|nr:hypothetical protein [Providencia rettgeri]MCX9094319.1 hypothetical protein [Providencia rettgeri]
MNESKMSYLIFISALFSFIILNCAYATKTIGCYYLHYSEKKSNNDVNTLINLKFKFKFKFNNEAKLTISSWQELYACQGNYTLKEIATGFNASIIDEQDCKIPPPQFVISKNANRYLIKNESLLINDPSSYQLIECHSE